MKARGYTCTVRENAGGEYLGICFWLDRKATRLSAELTSCKPCCTYLLQLRAWNRVVMLNYAVTSVRAGANFSVYQNSSVQRGVGRDQQIANSAYPFCPPAAQFRCNSFRKTRNIWMRTNDVIFLWSSMLKLTLFSTPPCHKYKIVNSVYSPQSAWSFFKCRIAFIAWIPKARFSVRLAWASLNLKISQFSVSFLTRFYALIYLLIIAVFWGPRPEINF